MQFGTLLRQLGRGGVPLPRRSSAFWVAYPTVERTAYLAIAAIAALLIEASPRGLGHQTRRFVARLGRALARETTWSVQPELVSGLRSMSEVIELVSPADFSDSDETGRRRLDVSQT